MIHDSFIAFTQSDVIPRQTTNPEHIRPDGAKTGSSRGMVGQFQHNGRNWVVHEDTHFEPQTIAFAAAETGADPFIEEDTPKGRCLSLTPELRAKQRSLHKYLYICSWT